jgi:hypothetical protein
MKKIIFLISIFLGLGLINIVLAQCVCCSILNPNNPLGADVVWMELAACTAAGGNVVDSQFCSQPPPSECTPSSQPPPSSQSPSQEQFKPGSVVVRWEPRLISICPPGILGGGPCSYPSLIDLIKRINQLLLTISPPLLVILIILGGFMYLLTPLNVEEQIKKGHRFIKYAIIGYILLLLVTLIFTIISAVLGGPSP